MQSDYPFVIRRIRRGAHADACALPSGWGAQAECARSAKVSIDTQGIPHGFCVFCVVCVRYREQFNLLSFSYQRDFTDYTVFADARAVRPYWSGVSTPQGAVVR